MALTRFLVLAAVMLLAGCGGTTSTVGDTNDPATSGTDEAQAKEAEGTVQTADSEPQ